MLSNKLTFSLASFVVLFAFVLCLVPTTVEAEDPPLTWATKPNNADGFKTALMSHALTIPTGPNSNEITYDAQTAPPLPRGLSIRKIESYPTVYGIAEVGSATKTYTVTAHYKDQSATQTFDLVVHSFPEFLANLNPSHLLPERVFEAGEAISFVLPAATDEDGDTVTYTLGLSGGSGLPYGLSFDALTRTVSGAITTAGLYDLTYTAVDGGSYAMDLDTQIFQTIIIEPPLTWATKPNNAEGFKTATMAHALTLPTGPNDDAITYDAQTVPPLPRGLSIVKIESYARVYGIPEVGSATQTYTVTARYKDQSATQTFDLVVHSYPEFLNINLNRFDELPERVFKTGEAISFVLPEATDEDGDTVTYTLGLSGGSGLPDGLSFDALTRAVNGTIATAGEHRLVYTAVDGGSYVMDLDREIFQRITITEDQPPPPPPVVVGPVGQVDEDEDDSNRDNTEDQPPSTSPVVVGPVGQVDEDEDDSNRDNEDEDEDDSNRDRESLLEITPPKNPVVEPQKPTPPKNPVVDIPDSTLTWSTKPEKAVGVKSTVMSHTLAGPTGPGNDVITYDAQTAPPLPRGLSIRKVVGYPTVYGIPEVGSATKTYLDTPQSMGFLR